MGRRIVMKNGALTRWRAKAGLYYHTVRHLTRRQLAYQLWLRLRGRPRLCSWTGQVPVDAPKLVFPITVTLLNQTVPFERAIDWNYAANGKLWTYHLNYFEYLPDENGLALIYDFIRQTPHLIDGLEPYPTSLRVVNWQRFLRRHRLHEPVVEAHLYAQTAGLRARLEYQLGGNHLLENACALLTMALHFRQPDWFQKAAWLLREQLAEQILPDGGHYERSPVYHQLLTNRLLDVYKTLRETGWLPDPSLVDEVGQPIGQMLGWLRAVTFRNGEVPMVNDAAHGMAPSTAELLTKAAQLELVSTSLPLGESGYRWLTTARLECFVDVGPVGPDHQPGHAHADTLSFLLNVDEMPLLTDVGTSTYQVGDRRRWERSTAAHNTVTVEGQDSSEVWGGFRVGRRASVALLTDTEQRIVARHDGYHRRFGCYHERTWHVPDAATLLLTDTLTNEAVTGRQHFYIPAHHPLTVLPDGVHAGPVQVTFFSPSGIGLHIGTRTQAAGFNRYRDVHCVAITFRQHLTTTITVTHERTTADVLFCA